MGQLGAKTPKTPNLNNSMRECRTGFIFWDNMDVVREQLFMNTKMRSKVIQGQLKVKNWRFAHNSETKSPCGLRVGSLDPAQNFRQDSIVLKFSLV